MEEKAKIRVSVTLDEQCNKKYTCFEDFTGKGGRDGERDRERERSREKRMEMSKLKMEKSCEIKTVKL